MESGNTHTDNQANPASTTVLSTPGPSSGATLKDDSSQTPKFKRPFEDGSPTNLTPPSNRQKLDDSTSSLDLFTTTLVEALKDDRVVSVLFEHWNSAVKKQMVEAESKIVKLQDELNKTNEKLLASEERLDDLEQYSRRNSLRVWLPEMENKGECTDSLIIDHAKTLGVTIQPTDIDRSHRVGAVKEGNPKPRAVIVKFSSYKTRQKLFDARRKNKNIFISEDLTRGRSTLFYSARQEKRAGRFEHVWTRDGRIHIRVKDKGTVHTVATTAQLNKLVDQNPL